ncbi:hypothetical protein EJ04DRAFT_509174 [Polyplosphaeria fusca]|uniref:Zn(2)-C6 fungal-type domain-containing protein n=1 Tax=Polyplosphaeria fusca TaxID=682080 RepID=A0A9P4R589_9PLEO|nr:hypothetical protein EJ04DRAFT_509174 [Polyplosphaeria fusca]
MAKFQQQTFAPMDMLDSGESPPAPKPRRTPSSAGSPVPDQTPENKPKRVRTGCLTCRMRHLKCDEGLPHCNNCLKSNRECRRGTKLNFISIDVRGPSSITKGPDWHSAFEDESRQIASEYVGGRERYPPNPLKRRRPPNPSAHAHHPHMAAPPMATAQHSMSTMQSAFYPQDTRNVFHPHGHVPMHHHSNSNSHSESAYASNPHGVPAAAPVPVPDPSPTPAPSRRAAFLETQEEVLFMQVFVEEVALWMDAMDPMQHFATVLSTTALSEQMLLNACLACGARHLALVNTKYNDEKALHYYNKATRLLLDQLQDQNRDIVMCATTAVILNVYEIMSERALQRMNHIAGARALIKECGWNATTQGIGAACFWLNVGMELLSCLHYNWQVAWNPADWQLNMDMQQESSEFASELWCHRILYIIAKVCNFRATIPKQEAPEEKQERAEEWNRLKLMAETWDNCIHDSMRPKSYLLPGQTLSGSAFPDVWVFGRTPIVAQLFYHTAMLLLAQIHPYRGPSDASMTDMQFRHAQYICGITAHVKDRGVASVALRSLAIAASCLQNRREQEEVLAIFEKIRQETGWRIGFLSTELQEKWGWNREDYYNP